MIRGISNNYDVNFMYSNPAPPRQKQPLQSNISHTDNQTKASSKIARNVSVGAAIIAVVGSIAYYLKTGKKAKADVGAQVQEKLKNTVQHIIPLNKETGAFKYNVMNGDKFVKSVESDGYIPSSDTWVKNGLERQIYTQWADGRTATTQDLLTPDKVVYERTTVKGNDIIRYNFAHSSEGKVLGFAREHTHHGLERNITPLSVKMYDGKEVKAENINELVEVEPTFHPKTMISTAE